jgi:hypothetical protein
MRTLHATRTGHKHVSQIGSFAYMERTITASFFGSGDPRADMPALLSLFLKKVVHLSCTVLLSCTVHLSCTAHKAQLLYNSEYLVDTMLLSPSMQRAPGKPRRRATTA